MEAKVYLSRYRLAVDQIGLPLVIRRSAGEATFKAEDLTEHKDVALQVVPVMALRTVVREQLEAEARDAQKITHINIPTLLDFGFEEGQIVYVTEYFDGTTADQWVKANGVLPVGAVLRIAQQVVNASSVATFHGIVHHAINPNNIMLVPGQTTEGEWPLIKLLNIVGVAPNFTPSENPDPESADPVNFASPEQLQTGTVDFRSQMYSLGATLWFLITGRAPLGGAATVERGGRVPTPVRRLLMHMLAADPAERPLDPLALQAAIRDCLAPLDRRDAVATKFGVPVASETAAVRPAKAPRRAMPWKPLALAAALIGLAAVAAVVVAQHTRPRQAIGVPIGVPENTARTNTANVATPAATPAVAQANTYVSNPPGSEPPVLTSTADAPAEDETQTASADSSAFETQTATAQASASPEAVPQNTREPARTYASNSPTQLPQADEPPPPSEGPDETTPAAPQVETGAVAQNAPADVSVEPASPPRHNESRTPAVISEKPAAIAEKPRAREKAPEVSGKRASKRVRVASSAQSGQQPMPRGSVRAQYLGTTPDGELVFGLPSNERGYVSPPRPAVRAEPASPSRRVRPALRVPDEELPVLPALPPDE
jgi:hypothetical protein